MVKEAPAVKIKSTKERKTSLKKIFVLDTSVILYDHNSILHFEEHDVAIPITVLEELDEFKKGSDTKNYEARQFIRFLDKKAGDKGLQDWIDLNDGSRGKFKVIMNVESHLLDALKVFGGAKNDHKILNAALKLSSEEKEKQVILAKAWMSLLFRFPKKNFSTLCSKIWLCQI